VDGSLLLLQRHTYVHFFVPLNAALARDPHEGNCEIAGVESREESEDPCNYGMRGIRVRNDG